MKRTEVKTNTYDMGHGWYVDIVGTPADGFGAYIYTTSQERKTLFLRCFTTLPRFKQLVESNFEEAKRIHKEECEIIAEEQTRRFYDRIAERKKAKGI